MNLRDGINMSSDSPMVFHCIIHRGALYRKCFSLDMKEATVTVLLTMNGSRLGRLKRRHSQHFQEEIGSAYDNVFYHSAVRYFTTGLGWNRLFFLLRNKNGKRTKLYCSYLMRKWSVISRIYWTQQLISMKSVWHFKKCSLEMMTSETKPSLLYRHTISQNPSHLPYCKTVFEPPTLPNDWQKNGGQVVWRHSLS